MKPGDMLRINGKFMWFTRNFRDDFVVQACDGQLMLCTRKYQDWFIEVLHPTMGLISGKQAQTGGYLEVIS